MRRFLLAALPLAALAATQPAAAHPKLVGSTPADGAAVAAPAAITLNFSERMTPRFTSAELAMTGMPGVANHPVMPMKAAQSFGEDGKSLTLRPASPLVAGSYRVSWKAVGADTHRVEGAVTFTVR